MLAKTCVYWHRWIQPQCWKFVLAWHSSNLPGLLTLFDDLVEIGHSLDICPGNIFVLSEDGPNLAAEFLEHVRVSHKKPAS